MSPTRKKWDVYERDRLFEFDQIRKKMISELKFGRVSREDTIEKLTESCCGFYDDSEMIASADTKDISQFLIVEVRLLQKGDRVRYFKPIQDQENIIRILLKMNKILKGFGLARLSVDDKMISLLCQGVEQT